jgi:hypothetical protein
MMDRSETQTVPESPWSGPEDLVVEFAGPDTLVAPQLQVLLAQWTTLAAGRIGPQRAKIEPRALAPILPRIQIHEVIDGGQSFKVRLVGTALVAAVGRDFTGATFGAADTGLLVRRLVAALQPVARYKRPIRTSAPRTAAKKISFLSAENLWLPLSEDGTAVTQILGCSIFSEPENIGCSVSGKQLLW